MDRRVEFFLESFKLREVKKIKPRIEKEYEWLRPFPYLRAARKEDGTIGFNFTSQLLRWESVVEGYAHLLPEEKQKEMKEITRKIKLYLIISGQQAESHFKISEYKLEFRIIRETAAHQFKKRVSEPSITAGVLEELKTGSYGKLEKEWKLKKMFSGDTENVFLEKIVVAVAQQIEKETQGMIDYLNLEIEKRFNHVAKVIIEETKK